jgi:hypothetical protein
MDPKFRDQGRKIHKKMTKLKYMAPLRKWNHAWHLHGNGNMRVNA